MKFRIDRRIRMGYFTAYFLLIISYLLLFYTNSEMLGKIESANQTSQSMVNLSSLFSQIKDMESGVRGYLITGNENFLESYYANKNSFDTTLNTIWQSLDDDTLQRLYYDTLKNLVSEKLYTMRRVVGMYQAADKTITDSIKAFVNNNAQGTMQSFREVVLVLQDIQKKAIASKKPELSNSSRAIRVINLTSLIIASLIAIYSLITYTQENKARRKADEKAILYRKQLEQRIDQLKILNDELTQLKGIEKFAATGRMARMIAHEVRNPLTNIGLANDQLREIVNHNEEINMLMDMIKRNTERISHLVSNLLNATKFVELKLSNVYIDNLLDDTLEMAKDRIELNSVSVERNYYHNSCRLSVDEEKIKIAFLNIIVNAVEAMEPGKGVLQIAANKVNSNCVVIIKDNGVGMPAEFLSRLFEPFFTSKDNGNGLGLTNSQNIILHHKGNISVKSEIGRGTIFTVTLPCTN